MTHATVDDARAVLSAYTSVGFARNVEPLAGGLIHATFAIDSDKGRFVLQKLHPVIKPAVHENIVAVTRELRAHNLVTPQIVPTDDGSLYLEIEDVWRMMTRVPGVSVQSLSHERQAREAGRSLGAFHAACAGLVHTFVGVDRGAHDTDRHLEHLGAVLEAHKEHRLFREARTLADSILEAAKSLPRLKGLLKRIVHGDPKVSNLLWEEGRAPEDAKAVAWVDLDTVAPLEAHLELGDAFRSWCNPKREDQHPPTFSLPLFESAWRGYVEAGPVLGGREIQAVLHGVEWVALELAARFCADAITESYFGWDKTAYATAGDHNLARAKVQWSLHRRVVANRAQRAGLMAKVARELGAAS